MYVVEVGGGFIQGVDELWMGGLLCVGIVYGLVVGIDVELGDYGDFDGVVVVDGGQVDVGK